MSVSSFCLPLGTVAQVPCSSSIDNKKADLLRQQRWWGNEDFGSGRKPLLGTGHSGPW